MPKILHLFLLGGCCWRSLENGRFNIVMEEIADDTHYNYHMDMNGNFLLCGKDGHPVE